MMPELARICFEDGTLSMPIATPYDRQLLREELHVSVRRYQSVRLKLDQREWLVSHNADDSSARCAACDEALPRLRCAVDSLTLCLPCATDGFEG